MSETEVRETEPKSPWRAETILPIGAAILGALVLGVSLGDGPPDPPPLPGADDETAIVAVLEDQYAALLAMDADRYAAHLHPDAVWENALGDRYEGREAIREFNQRVAATMEGARYDGWEATVRFVGSDVAVVDVQTTLVGQQVGGRRLVDRPMLNVYLLRKEGEVWSIVHTRIRDRWSLSYAEP